MRVHLLRAGAAMFAHASCLAAALALVACSAPPKPVLNVNGSVNIGATMQEDFDWLLQNTTQLTTDVQQADVSAANAICSAYPFANDLWTTAAANPAMPAKIKTDGNNFQASVAAGCKGAPFTTFVSTVAAVNAAWAQWLDAADQGGVNLTPSS